MKILGIELTEQEFDFLMCEQAKGKELKVVDGKVVAVERVITEQEKAQIRINELKSFLANTDYQAIKYMEGFISESDYAPIRTQRQIWREEINSLGG